VNTRQQTERSAKKRKAGSGGSATHTSTLFQMLQVIHRGIQVFFL
jgi:adenine nucleotide transporter 17